MKRIGFLSCRVCVLTCILFSVVSCKKKTDFVQKGDFGGEEKIKIVASIFPLCDWVKHVAGENADVSVLINGGTDLHSWQPGAKDIVTVAGGGADLFVFVGGESDFWVYKLYPEMKKKGVAFLNLMEQNAAVLEPAEGEHSHRQHDSDFDDGSDTNDSTADIPFDADKYDEHIWLSLKRIPYFLNSIAEALSAVDEKNAAYYQANAKSYADEILELQSRAEDAVRRSPKNLIVVADRFPFAYFCRDLNLQHRAAFYGCSAETESSFDVVVSLSKTVRDNDLHSIVITETGDRKLAETVLKNAGADGIQIRTLNSMQGKVEVGKTFTDLMNENIAALELILK